MQGATTITEIYQRSPVAYQNVTVNNQHTNYRTGEQTNATHTIPMDRDDKEMGPLPTLRPCLTCQANSHVYNNLMWGNIQ